MGILDNFEKKLDRMVNGAFAKAFRSEVQPVEIAAGLQRELDDRATVVSRARTVVPNIFVVELSPADHERLAAYEQTVADELAVLVREYAQQQRYAFVGPAEVSLALDESLGTGLFRIRSEVRAGPQSTSPLAGRRQWAAAPRGRWRRVPVVLGDPAGPRHRRGHPHR